MERILGLVFDKYPREYKDYVKEEGKVVLDLLSKEKDFKLLDVGCGSDMHIQSISKLSKEYVGIEFDDSLLYEVKDKIKQSKNLKILQLNVHKLSENYKKNHFDIVIGLWNALGCEGDEIHWLNEVSKVTKGKIILSLVEKGHLDIREQYYIDMNSSYMIMDDGKETIFSPIWGYSRAFSKEDIENYAKICNLKVEKFITLAKIGFLAILSKK